MKNNSSHSRQLSYIDSPLTTEKGFLFGYQIFFIPDFLLDHTLLGKEASARIVEHTRRWNQFIANLWRKPGDVTYALRYDLNEKTRSIDTYILGRLQCENSAESLQLANNLLCNLKRSLVSFGFEPELFSSDELEIFSKNDSYRYCFEVSQKEVQTLIRNDIPSTGKQIQSSQSGEFSIPEEFVYPDGERRIYGTRPWWGTSGTFLTPFNAIAAQNSAVSVLILLIPTELKPEEKRLLSEIARQSESLAQMQTKGTNFGNPQVNPSQNKTDPQLRWESKLFAANLRRLNYPFLTTLFCFSDDFAAAQQVAATFSSSIREEQSDSPPFGESEIFPSEAAIHSYDNHSDIQKVHQYLVFDPLSLNLQSVIAPHNDLRRLRYLMDAKGAASVFRFPVSVEGGVPGIPVKQRPPDFHPGARTEDIPEDAIDLGRFHVGGRAYVSYNAFTKHALVLGFTGSGKSNTCMYLLDQFWRKFQIPFMVIESAKKEYRGLRNVDVFKDNLRIYTLGNATLSPFRFNPFLLIPGVRVESHIAHLQTCFEGALPPVGPLPSILSEALYVVYRELDWSLTDQADKDDGRNFPTMQDFYRVIEQVVKQRGYQGEIKGNLEAAIKGRLKPLLFGSKGKMFSCRRSYPEALDLFEKPVIIELNDLNDQDKSLIMMFLLTLLREYRELHPSEDLTHVTLVEEAHNVLPNLDAISNSSEFESDIKAKSVQSFCNMLAEMRAYGEGLIIADQSPEKLARDAMRNTNVQIAHQLRDAHDRDAIANAMIMSDEQREFLGKCETGRAAIYFTGLQKTTFIDVPVYKDENPPTFEGKTRIENCWKGFSDQLRPADSDKEVKTFMQSVAPELHSQEEFTCSLCTHICEYREKMSELVVRVQDEFDTIIERFDKQYRYAEIDQGQEGKSNIGKLLSQFIFNKMEINSEKDFELACCFTQELLSRSIEQTLSTEAKPIFINYLKEYF